MHDIIFKRIKLQIDNLEILHQRNIRNHRYQKLSSYSWFLKIDHNFGVKKSHHKNLHKNLCHDIRESYQIYASH